MAANFITQASLVQPKPSLNAKTLQNPSLTRFSKLSPSSSFCFLPKNRTLSVGKLSLASSVSASKSSVLEEYRNNKNPIIVIDNYDSFTYNLCQYMGELGCHFEVYRNDELTVEELKRKNPRGVLISPGPGTPQDSGISLQTVLELGPLVPLFGVCMGLQCIGEAFGGKIVRSPYGVMHGKCSPVCYDEKGEDGLFAGLSNPFNAGRYHSLVIEKDSFPDEALEVTAWTEDGLIMAASHKVYKHIQGIQFHPESIVTSEGISIVRNFIKLVERKEAAESRA
ncbi:Anthranilate synthase beta subunit 2 [Hibiscus syriacus]|uniref:anthranilate synthase n=1 Tax=Hibiscus syriacus TaxID=106335 RepID=A0A6A2WPH5_HIBSY|nr:anthranilate synthase beta subunit 2, chloroplastic-like [Hibiscus syriacus]KAE8662632.1 Anthranilate synthase beta subunit 2 [Hibiscus syriacus]